jgi:UDP-N-acetylglucosamine transferase subunit ALG13
MLGARDMIFASIGSMLPFDRFTRGVDEWAAANPHTPVFLQIGEGEYEPRHCEWARIVPHSEYQRRLNQCSLFVAHVGMGSILQALEIGKQTLLMPRRAALREHTTDHQLHTAAKFRGVQGLRIVDDVADLQREISRLVNEPMSGSEGIPSTAPEAFTARLHAFLTQGLSMLA